MSAQHRRSRSNQHSPGSAGDQPPKGVLRPMFIRKILPAFAVAALGVVAATAFGHGTRDVKCPPGNTNPAYCTTTPDTTSTSTSTSTPTETTPTQTVTAPSQSPPPPQGTSGNDNLQITQKPNGTLTLL